MVNKHTDLSTRAQALALAEYGVPMDEIKAITHLTKSTIYRYKSMARQRGYDPAISRVLKDEYLVDEIRSGRPPVLTEKQKEDLVTSVKKDKSNREKSAQYIAFEHGTSSSTVLRVLHAANLHKRKPSTKPGLTSSMKEARLQFALQHDLMEATSIVRGR